MMAGIQIGRVVLGGLVAGLVILSGEYVLNSVILAEHWKQMRLEFAIEEPHLAEFAVGSLISIFYGIVLVWLYATMQPRFVTSLRTTTMAALTFWAVAYLLFLLSMLVAGVVSVTIALVSIAWGLIEAPVAALAGVKIYRSGQDRDVSGRSVGKPS